MQFRATLATTGALEPMLFYKALVTHNPNEKAQREGRKATLILETAHFGAETNEQAYGQAGMLLEQSGKAADIDPTELCFRIESFG